MTATRTGDLKVRMGRIGRSGFSAGGGPLVNIGVELLQASVRRYRSGKPMGPQDRRALPAVVRGA